MPRPRYFNVGLSMRVNRKKGAQKERQANNQELEYGLLKEELQQVVHTQVQAQVPRGRQ